MVLNGFDSVKTLKAIAMANFSRRRKLKWLFEFLLFLFLISHRSSLFSLAAPALRHFLRRLLVVLNSHIFVFLFFHAMLLVVYSLSSLTDNKSASNRTDADSVTATSGGDSPETLVAPVDDSVDEILVVDEKNTAAAAAPAVEEVPTDATPAAVSAAVRLLTEISPPTPAAESAVQRLAEKIPEIKQYRRTESARFEETNRETSKFRRSKTEVVRREASVGFLNSVDEMDIDDFNRTVESFIAAQKMHIGGRISV